MTSETENLSPRLLVLYDALHDKGDVHVLHLFKSLTGEDSNNVADVYEYLGPYITRLNRKLKKQRVSPGALKGTYRLYNLTDA